MFKFNDLASSNISARMVRFMGLFLIFIVGLGVSSSANAGWDNVEVAGKLALQSLIKSQKGVEIPLQFVQGDSHIKFERPSRTVTATVGSDRYMLSYSVVKVKSGFFTGFTTTTISLETLYVNEAEVSLPIKQYSYKNDVGLN